MPNLTVIDSIPLASAGTINIPTARYSNFKYTINPNTGNFALVYGVNDINQLTFMNKLYINLAIHYAVQIVDTSPSNFVLFQSSKSVDWICKEKLATQ